MSYLKIVFNFIKYLIIENPIKVLMLVGAFISFQYAGTLPGNWVYYDLVSEIKDGNTYVYVIESQGTDNNYDIYTSDKKEVIKNDQFRLWDYHDGNILLYIIFGILIFIVSVGTIIGLLNNDDDIGWDFEECYERTINNLIYCELEDGVFYYMALDRLIGKSNTQIASRRISDHFNVYSLSDIRKCPKFSTKTQNRNNLLDKLGI
jgi:hypothetical protein